MKVTSRAKVAGTALTIMFAVPAGQIYVILSRFRTPGRSDREETLKHCPGRIRGPTKRKNDILQ